MANGEITEKEINSQIKIWENFAKSNKGFKINPDKEWVKNLAKGVLHNESSKGLRFCPCRLTTKNREKGIKLICPCNFESQRTWEEKGECWCKLFIQIKR